MSKQTAVEWLVSQLNKQGFAAVVTDEEIQKAKEMEKKQIIDAANGYTQTEYLGVTQGEQYYNKEYGK